MAMGLVFVLLLGEIDLSAGTASGLCAALTAKLLFMPNHRQPWYIAILAALVVGVLIGLLIGWLRAKVGIPSFVITLAAFLGFQGVTLLIVGTSGAIPVSSNVILGIESADESVFMASWLSWAILAVTVIGFGLYKFGIRRSRIAQGLPGEPTSVIGGKLLVLALLGAGFVQLMSVNRIISNGSNAFFSAPKSEGAPYIVLIVLVLLIVLSFILARTRYGRHIYAVGGNEEAARRAGVRVDRIRISVFVICSGLAAVAGLVSASYLGSVQSNAGAGNTLLLAVGAAVIGGTSLFGGRGKVIDAVIGGLVVAVIQNGMSDLIKGADSAGWQYVVTGLVLLLAAGFDAISRRSANTSG
jgi:D-xylose transport system permease protein